jgi:hypothetical protein
MLAIAHANPNSRIARIPKHLLGGTPDGTKRLHSKDLKKGLRERHIQLPEVADSCPLVGPFGVWIDIDQAYLALDISPVISLDEASTSLASDILKYVGESSLSTMLLYRLCKSRVISHQAQHGSAPYTFDLQLIPESKNPTPTIFDLLSLPGWVGHGYTHFKRRVLGPAIETINNDSDIIIDHFPIAGHHRRISAIRVTVTLKPEASTTNPTHPIIHSEETLNELTT